MMIAALNSLLFEVFPLQLLDPLWQLKLIGQVLAVIMPALVGMLVIHLAANINTKNTDLYNNAQLARKVAIWIAMILFLFIPIQFYAGAKVVQRMKNVDSSEVTTIRQFVRRLRMTQSEAQMRALAASIADPPVLPDKLEGTFAQVRGDWAQRLANTANQKEELSAKKYNATWQAYLANSIRNSIQCFLFAFAFLTIGQRPSRSEKLLDALSSYGKPSSDSD